MYVQGVSTRKVKAITEELCGHGFSASAISEATARLDAALKSFAERRLAEPYPYPILDARYERVCALGVETHENRLEATRYLNMEYLRERKKEVLRAAHARHPCRPLPNLTHTTHFRC
jgi:transposase-like protein